MKIEKDPYTALYPNPVALITCDDNIITIAWISTACYDPPMLCFAMNHERYSYELIKKSGEFVVNIPKKDMIREIDICGTVSGRDVKKFEKTGLTKVMARKVKAPMIKECPVNIECRVEKIIPLGSHDLFVGRIVSVDVDEDIMDNGEINYKKADPLCYIKGDYRAVGEILETAGFTKR